MCSPLISQQCRPTHSSVEIKDVSEVGIDEQASLWLGSRGTGGIFLSACATQMLVWSLLIIRIACRNLWSLA